MKEVNLPGPNITLKDAIALFKTKGLEMGDLVTLLGKSVSTILISIGFS